MPNLKGESALPLHQLSILASTTSQAPTMTAAATMVGDQFNGSSGTMDDGRPLGDADVFRELRH
jgi:hypothetical protein